VYRNVPEHADETLEVPCPAHFECGGEVELDGITNGRADLRRM
jgi:hypothetical protein